MRSRYLIAAFSLALALVAPSVFAAGTVTFNNTGCADFTVSNNGGGNFTLTCVPVVGPVCTITPLTPNPVINTTITVTAACNGGGGYTYVWTGVTPACNTPTCADTQTTAGARNYTVVATSGGNQGPPSTYTLNWQAQAALPPSGCSLTANPTSLPTGGGAVTLTASCTTGVTVPAFIFSARSL